jgi:hypothetical protein
MIADSISAITTSYQTADPHTTTSVWSGEHKNKKIVSREIAIPFVALNTVSILLIQAKSNTAFKLCSAVSAIVQPHALYPMVWNIK